MDNKTINNLYTLGGIALILIVTTIFIQGIIFTINPLPTTAEGYLELYNNKPMLGAMSLGAVYLIHNVLLIVPYLALFFRLKETNYVMVLSSMVAIIITLSMYYNASPCFEFLSLSQQYYSTTDEFSRQILLLSANTSLLYYRSFGLTLYYISGGIATLLITLCMRKDSCFGKPIVIVGFITVLSMFYRAAAGNIGYNIVLITMIPWIIFSILLAINLFKIRSFYRKTTYYCKIGYEI